MVRNRKPTGTAMSLPAGIGVGVAIAVTVTVAGVAVVAWLLNTGKIAESGIGYGAMVTLLLSSAIGAWVAVALVKHRQLVVGLITGAVYLLLLIGLNAFFFGGQYQGIVPSLILVMGASGAVVLAGSWRPSGNRIQRRHKISTG